MIKEIFYSSVCACCGHRYPHNIMQIGTADMTHPNILELLISSVTETKRNLLEFVYLQVEMIMSFTIRT